MAVPLAVFALGLGLLTRGATDLWVQVLVHLLTVIAVIAAASDPSTPGLRRGIVVLLVLVALGDLWAAAPFSAGPPFSHSIDRGLLNDLNGLAFFFLFSLRTENRWEENLWRWTGPLLAVFALPGLALFLLKRGGHPFGTLINSNVLAAALLLAGPPSVALWWKKWKPAGIALAVLGLLLLASTGSRAAAGAAVLGAVLYFSPPSRRWWALAALAVIFGGISLHYLDADRIGWWKSAVLMLTKSEGVGPGAFGEAYPRYRAVSLGLNALFAHNFLLESAAERGVLGALVFFALPALALGRAFRNFDGASTRWKATAAGMTAFLAHSLLHVGFSIPGVSWLFWAAAGEWWGSGDPTVPMSRVGRAGSVVAALAAGILSLRLYVGDEYLARAGTDLTDGNVPAARVAVERGLRWNPREPELYSIEAAVLSSGGDWNAAYSNLHRAVRLAPASARFRAETGEAAFRLGRREEAVRCYEEAVRLLPLNAKYPARLEELRRAEGGDVVN